MLTCEQIWSVLFLSLAAALWDAGDPRGGIFPGLSGTGVSEPPQISPTMVCRQCGRRLLLLSACSACRRLSDSDRIQRELATSLAESLRGQDGERAGTLAIYAEKRFAFCLRGETTKVEDRFQLLTVDFLNDVAWAQSGLPGRGVRGDF